MERVTTVLAEARARGLDVRTEADRLIVRGPRRHEDLARRLLDEKPAVLALLAGEEDEITWRVAAMRPQVPRTGAIPLLVARRVDVVPGRCLSCGEAVASAKAYRCSLCLRAVQHVLADVREGLQP
jgi:hypothetical protein